MKPQRLSLLVMHVSTHCDQACAHCSIWKGKADAARELSEEDRVSIIEEAHLLGARSVLFTGGEPLLCHHLERLCREARLRGLSVQIATNGLGLGRAAAWIGELVDEAYVSLEGPIAIHDAIRGAGMFRRLSEAVEKLRAQPKRPRLVGRSVIARHNARNLGETVNAARALSLDALSFLGVDVTSNAFGGDPENRAGLGLDEDDVAALRASISRLFASGALGRFVCESEEKLERLADALANRGTNVTAPECNAPEWSSVVESDGGTRPCFFQPVVDAPGPRVSLGRARRSQGYAAALRSLGPGNPICATCVCPKHIPSAAARVRAGVSRVLPRWGRSAGVRP